MGPMELILIVVLALMVFGPAKLPEIMGQIGKGINDFRRATSDLSDEFNRTIQAELQETKAVVDEARSAVTEAKSVVTEARTAVTDVHTTVNSTLTGTAAPVRTASPGEGLTSSDALSAANGTNAEPHAETNGTTPAESTAPMADTSQWSWETAETTAVAEPSDAAAQSADAEAASTTTAAAVPPESVSPESASPESASGAADAGGASTPSEASTTAERSKRDELQPPY